MKNKSNLSRYLISLAVFVILNPFICYILKQLNKNASKIANMNADMTAYISLDVLSNVLVAVFISVGVFLIYKIMKYKNLAINIIYSCIFSGLQHHNSVHRKCIYLDYVGHELFLY